MKPAYTVLTAGYPILLRRSPVSRILYSASKLILYKRHPAPLDGSVAVLLVVESSGRNACHVIGLLLYNWVHQLVL